MQSIAWKTKVEYYDIETGDQITKQVAQQQYTIIKTEKHGTTFNKNRTSGVTTITKLCRKRTGIQKTIW